MKHGDGIWTECQRTSCERWPASCIAFPRHKDAKLEKRQLRCLQVQLTATKQLTQQASTHASRVMNYFRDSTEADTLLQSCCKKRRIV